LTKLNSRIPPGCLPNILHHCLIEWSNPIPQRFKILIVERLSSNLFIKFDGAPQESPRLLDPTNHAFITGEIELDQRIIVMQLPRSEQDCFCLLNSLTAARA
jgi:hypothetical protein